MTGHDELTTIEERAIEQVPDDVENVSSGPEPMLCPPVCGAAIAGGLAKGYLAGREFYGDSQWADVDHETDEDVPTNASVDEIITAIES